MPRTPRKINALTHLDDRGRARMVDVGAKPATRREAVAEGFVRMAPATLRALLSGSGKKGDVLAVARVAGIQGAKRTAELIPLCHSLPLECVQVSFEPLRRTHTLRIVAQAACTGPTGVEMEALTAVSIAALTVYDMLKALDKGMVLGPIRLLKKTGGRSGTWVRNRRAAAL